MGAWGFILSFSLLLWIWNFPYWKFRLEKKASKQKFPGEHCSLPPWVYVEIKQDNIQVLHKSRFLSFPFKSRPRAAGAFPARQPAITVARRGIWIVHAWFSRAQKSPDPCPEKTLATLEFLSEPAVIHQDGVGQTGRCWDGPNSFPPTPPATLRLLRLGPGFPTARSGSGKCKPQNREREGKGGVSSQYSLDNNLLGFSLSLSGL